MEGIWKDVFSINLCYFQSANAEELEEREHHRKLEKNYGFRFNDDKETEEDE